MDEYREEDCDDLLDGEDEEYDRGGRRTELVDLEDIDGLATEEEQEINRRNLDIELRKLLFFSTVKLETLIITILSSHFINLFLLKVAKMIIPSGLKAHFTSLHFYPQKSTLL